MFNHFNESICDCFTALNDFGRVSDALKIKLSLYRKEISKFPNLRAAKLTQELDELQNETVNLQSNFLTNKRENNLETVLSISKKLKKFEIEWKKTAPGKTKENSLIYFQCLTVLTFSQKWNFPTRFGTGDFRLE